MKWEYLSLEEQKKYLRKARYLLEYGYVSGDEEELAKKIYDGMKETQ